MATFERSAHVDWTGTVKEGRGEVKAGTGAFTLPVTFPARVEAPGGKTSPEELFAAAHASCFAMAFSAGLGRAKTPPERLTISAEVTFDKVEAGWRVTTSNLTVRGIVPGISQEDFAKAAEAAKVGCPISQTLQGNVEINVDATLES